MGDNIDKEFEEFQRELEIRNMKLKDVVVFEPDSRVDEIMDELKNKEITL